MATEGDGHNPLLMRIVSVIGASRLLIQERA